MNNRAVSMISLIITIIMIVIIAAISVPLLSNVISDSIMEDAKVEMKNVETVVDYAKAQIMDDRFIPNSEYAITEEELEEHFGNILTPDEKNQIVSINNDGLILAPHKYYLMNQERFDHEFGNAFNVSGIREAREYLVNYMDGVVLANVDGRRLTNGNEISVIPVEDIVRGQVEVMFTPNGNSEWSKQQATELSFAGKDTTITSVMYQWSQSISEPTVDSFVNSVNNHETVKLLDKTGNNWYLWVKVEYTDDGNPRIKYFRSNPFFIDNTSPTATMTVDEIRK